MEERLFACIVVIALAQIVIAYTQIVVILCIRRLWSSHLYLIERHCPSFTPATASLIAEGSGEADASRDPATTKPG